MRTAYTYDESSVRRREWGLAVLRVIVGFAFLMHGWQKLFEMGIPGVTGFFGQIGVPAPAMAAPLVSFVELVGGALLLVGLFTRWAAIPLAIDVVVATLLVHLPNGFFGPMGFELTLVLFGATLALALAGPGAFALDHVVARGPSGPSFGRRREDVGVSA